MRKNVDAILIINNERLCDVYADTPISVKDSFARADNILKDAVIGISELITVNSNGGIDLDFLGCGNDHARRRRCNHGDGKSQRRKTRGAGHSECAALSATLRQRHQQGEEDSL